MGHGFGEKGTKGDTMSKKKSICAECKYHFTEPTNYENDNHYCNVKVKEITDYVTGLIEAKGALNCYKINRNGDCPDFEKSTKMDYYPKHFFGGTVDFVRQKRVGK